MILLLLVSLIWGFSFGLFKGQLAEFDNNLTACLRMLLALPVFLPFLRLKGLTPRVGWMLVLIGAVQFGAMYSALNLSYSYLSGWEVALMTIFTPLYVLLFENGWKRKLDSIHLSMALVAVVGAGMIQWQDGFSGIAFKGFLLVQCSNLAFAFGQVAYRRLRPHLPAGDASVYAFPYLGAFGVTALATSFSGGWGQLTDIDTSQWLTLLYLGILASGLCFFWWNIGATKVNAGTLAVMNNIKVPLAVLVGVTVFAEEARIPNLLVGGGIMTIAVMITELRERRLSRRHAPLTARE